ncbi:hypothetical protein HBB16_09640 [Pseudonocardia sp. MCCB 268]|nr:hypothetical protein [Pseudonocardia cytotoxica]
MSTLELARLVDEAGHPPGVVNVVTGDGVTGRTPAAHLRRGTRWRSPAPAPTA